ncbi:MAG: hypothetical protein ACLGH3_02695 [Actinomycetota bacterium]
MRKVLASLMVVGLLTALSPAQADADAILISTDPAGDWSEGEFPELAPLGSALGQDLITASIHPDIEAGVMEFIIGVTELPPVGGTPEATRYTWNFLVGGAPTELDGKFTNYSRGACDPTAGNCPPPRDPGSGPFALRGNCTTTQNVTLCQELALLHAEFDADAATITIGVPIDLIDPDAACLAITPGTNIFGGFLSAAPSAFFSSSAAPVDVMDFFEVAEVNTCGG